MPVQWIPTTADVYSKILSNHHDQFSVFSSLTDLDGQFFYEGKIVTEWGFKNSDYPILKAISTGVNPSAEVEEQHSYFLASVQMEDNND